MLRLTDAFWTDVESTTGPLVSSYTFLEEKVNPTILAKELIRHKNRKPLFEDEVHLANLAKADSGHLCIFQIIHLKIAFICIL